MLRFMLKSLLQHHSSKASILDIFKSRDITLLTKVCLVKAIVFPVAMYACKSWTIKKAECPRMRLSNCGVGEDSSKSLGQQGVQTSQF